MKVTNDVRYFIHTKVNAKVAPVSIEQDFNDTVAVAKHFGTVLTDSVKRTVQAEFDALISAHPEMDGAELQSPLSGLCRFWVDLRTSSISCEYAEAKKLREDYVNEIVQRVCIDATFCKNTEELIALIDKVVGK